MRIKPYFTIAFALMLMMSSTVSAATITVDDSGGQDYTTIQAAINAANDSDTIIVYPGTYVEDVDVNKSVTIISQSGNPDDTIVQSKLFPNDHAFHVTRDNVTINGFTVKDAKGFEIAGIFLDEVQNNTISDNELINNYIGIRLKNSNNNTLNNNTAYSNDIGIKFENSNNNTLNNSIVCSNSIWGIHLQGSSNYNIIYNNYFNNSQDKIEITSNNNEWNVTNTSGPNIVGGPFIGGNYWATPAGTGFSQTCTDANNDGFCDLPNSGLGIFNVDTDFLPLNINASIDIEKFTNGFDADVAPGPSIQLGQGVTWTYNVTNTGNVVLNDIVVTDDQGVAVSCPSTTLQPGESMVCTATGDAQLGQYSNLGNVTAVYEGVVSCNEGTVVNDSDPSHYFGFKPSAGGLPYEPPEGVPAVNPFLLVGSLGIALVLFLRRELK